jgi:peroxiredoxin
LFSPYVKEDKPYCAAVATSYNNFMPEYDRTKNLYNLVLDAINSERQAKANAAWNEVLETAGTGYIDIELVDKTGTARKLSDLVGKVVLIDFSAYEMDQSVQYTFAMRDLYNKYHSRGFEIYQISLDRNKMLWEESTANIPWICVRDDNGPNSLVVRTYNIDTAPTTFLMSRKGAILSRNLSFKELTKSIEQNL